MPAPACCDLHGELNSTLNAGADRVRRPVDPASWVWSGPGQVASGNHCKTLETTVETSEWQPLGLVTSRVNQRGNHWLGSHQARVRGCEPEVRTSVRTCCQYAPECVPTVRTDLRTCCAQFAQLLRSPVARRRWRWGAYVPARASRGPVREYAA